MKNLFRLFPSNGNLHFFNFKKNGSLLLLLILGVLDSHAQSIHFCGEMHKPPMLTEGIPADEIIYDRFGNTYSLDELRFLNKKGKKVNCNTADIFQLTFVGNFTPEEESTICAVFSYLSSVISGNSNVQIPITIQQQQLASNVLGEATEFYRGDCGLVNSNILRAIRTGETGLPEGLPAGLIRITPQPTFSTEWYTLADEQAMIPLSSSYFDLYSVVLHEAMHMLGFASLIGENGNSIGGNNIYSYWDTYLSAGSLNAPLIVPDAAGDCCGAYMFNQADFPNMPTALGGGCSSNIQFRINGANIAPVNAVSATNPSVNTAGINSRLSHLAIPCASGGAAYVMNAEIAAGEARRVITPAEMEVLCALGYPLASCAAPCLLGAYDDVSPEFVITLNGVGATSSVTIPFATLLLNDIYPAGNVTLSICGSDEELIVSESTVFSSSFMVALASNMTTPGIYEFCYSISCGAVCDEATVKILVREDILAGTCSNNTCNLTCYANFDEFFAGTSLFDAQLALPLSAVNAGIVLANTCDVRLNVNEDDSRIASWFLCDGQGQREFPRFPLISAVPADCGITIRFRAAASLTPCANQTPAQNPMLGIYGLSGPACGLIQEPSGQPDIFTICNGVQAQRLGTVNVFLDPDANGTMDPDDIVNLDLVQYEINIPVNATFGVQQLIFYGEQGVRYYLDDLEVFSDCTPTIQVTPTIVEQCVDGTAVVNCELCVINTSNSQALPINFAVNIPAVPGVTVVPGGGFNQLGEANLLLTGSNTSPVCTTLTLTLATESTVIPGTELPLSLSVDSQVACTDLGPTNGDLLLVLQDCDPDPLSCQCPPGANTYVFGTNTSSVSYASAGGLPPDQNALSNACFEVNGRLNWDLDITLSNVHFIMNEGAEIVVPNGYGLYLSGNNLLEGCEHLWRGITIEGGGWFSANNSTIRDALYAVVPKGNSNIALIGNEFNANHVGVLAVSGMPVYNWGITGNEFICDQPLLPPFNGLGTAPPPITHAAFMLLNVPGTFVIGANNLMDGISNGLIAFRAGFSMEQCTIQNLVNNTDSPINQHGVWASNCFVANVQHNTFDNVGVGIFADNVNLNAEFNTIAGIPTAPVAGHAGIRYQNGANRSIRIRDNNILSAWNAGIRVNNCKKPALLRVKRNTVSLFPQDKDGAAIELKTCSSGFISDNDIHYNNANEEWTALGLQDCSSMTVYNNSSNGLGITNVGGFGNYFSANTISSEASFETVGFWVQNSVDRYCSNTTNGQLGNGWQFAGACSPSKFSCNSIGNAATGLRLSQFGTTTISIGEQPNQGNDWYGSYTNLGAYHESNADFIILKSQFSMPQAEIPSWNTGAGMGVSWFDLYTGQSTINCNLACAAPVDADEAPGGGGDGDLSGLGHAGSDDAAIARGDFSGDGISWMSRWRLYERLLAYPDMPADQDVQDFKTQAQGDALGQLFALSRQAELLQQGPDWAGQSFAYLQNDIQALTAQLQQTLKDGPLKGADAWRMEIRSLYADLHQAAKIYYRYEDWMAQQRKDGAASLLPALNVVQAVVQDAPLNVKNLQALQLEHDFFLNEAADPTALAEIKAIADQCPFEGGFAVYAARSIYSRFVPASRWNDEQLCMMGTTPPDKRNAQQERGGVANLLVLPNPANDLVFFQSAKPFGADARLEILSSTGTLWQSVNLDAQSNIYRLPSANWLAGMYHYRLLRPEMQPESGKFLIIH